MFYAEERRADMLGENEKSKMFTPEYIIDIRNGKYSRTGAVTKILRECGVNEFPVNVWEIARMLNFEVFDATFTQDNISGMMIDALEVPPMLERFHCKRAIILNKKEPKNIQSFTVAHELGHFAYDCNEETNYYDALHTKGKESLTEEEKLAKAKEDEIDEFAAMLLMPGTMFLEYINKSSNRYDRNALRAEMAKVCMVEEDAVDKRFDELKIKFDK